MKTNLPAKPPRSGLDFSFDRLWSRVWLGALLAFATTARAQTTNFFYEDFETDQAPDNWFADDGTWEIGIPTYGPASAHHGTNCVATVLNDNYPYGQASPLEGPSFRVPPAAGNPRLRFWHWYSFAGSTGGGRVQVKAGTNDWVSISPEYAGTGGEVWTQPLIDLSAYANKQVQMGFYFTAPPAAFGNTAPGCLVV